MDCLLLPASFSSLISWHSLLLYSTDYIPMITSTTMNRVSATIVTLSWSNTSRSTISKSSFNFAQLLPPKCISEFTRSRPPSESPNLLNHGLQVHAIMLSQCVSTSLHWLIHGHQVHTIMASKCISKPVWSWLPGASLSSLNLSLNEHLQIFQITASKFTQSWPPSDSPHL